VAELGTFQRIATHLAVAMRPLGDGVSDLDHFKQLMLKLGWKVEDLPPAYTQLATQVEALVAAAEALAAADAPGPDQLVALLGEVRSLIAAIQAITTAPGGVDASTFLADLGERLFELLLVEYLVAEVPFLARAFQLLGVIQFKVNAPTATRPGFTETRFLFAEIADVVADPLSVPRRIYGWGTDELDFELVADQLQELLLALDFPVAFRHPSRERGLAYQADPAITAKAIDTELVLSLLEVDLPGGPGEVGLCLLELPAEDPHPAGLILQPLVPSGVALDTDVAPDFKLSFRAGSDLAQTFGVFVRPGEIGVRYPFQPGTTPPTAGFGAALGYKPATSSLVLGTATGSRLQLAGATTGLFLDFVGADAELRLELTVEGLEAVLALGDQDSFIGSLFSGKDVTIPMPLGIRWSNRRGFTFTGGAGFEITVAPHLALGPITVDTAHVAVLATISTGAPPALTAGADVSMHGALGPIGFTVAGLGVQLTATFADGNAGPFDLQAGFKPPTGLGVAIDASFVSGGGFLSYDRQNGRYSGILQLRIAEIGLSAIGLLDTKLPDGQPGYSFLILVAATFPPIQLGYGFTLNGAGGLAGVNRTMVVDAIAAGLRDHALDSVLFPDDPVANAARIVSDLRTFFPPSPGRFVFGPMALIGWMTPTLLHIELGILLELPAPVRLVLLGQLRVTLPKEEEPLLEINVDILGVLDFEAGRISVDALIHDSHVGPFSITGGMAFRFDWGADDPVLVLAVGGLNPHYQAPPGFPALQPITVALGLDDNPRITLKGYYAVTANTYQIGALAELYAEAGGFNIYGWIGFDALFVYLPFFSFVTDFSGGVKLSRGSTKIAGIQLDATLSGVSPFRAKGSASISLWLFDVSVSFDHRFGGDSQIVPPAVDPTPLLMDALRDPRNWSGTTPPASWRAVSVAAPPNQTDVFIDPVGGVLVRERVLPLNRRITRFGDATPSGPGEYDVTDASLGGGPTGWTPVEEAFAPAQFEELSDAEKLSLPSFARMDAGVSLAGTALEAGPALGTDLVYETKIVDRPWAGAPAPAYPLPLRNQLVMLAAGAAARAPFRVTGAQKFVAPGPARVKLDDEPYVIAGVDDLVTRAGFGLSLSQNDAFSALARHLELHPEDRGTLQVVPRTEAVAHG
jgi:hypothetical protein